MNNTFYVDMTQDRVLQSNPGPEISVPLDVLARKVEIDIDSRLENLRKEWHRKEGEYYIINGISYSYQELRDIIQFLIDSTDEKEKARGWELHYHYLKTCDCCGTDLLPEEDYLCHKCEEALENASESSLYRNEI